MEPFTTLTAVAAPLDIAKIDTGMIVPGRFQRIRRRLPEVTYADVFLHDLRFDEQDRPRLDFVLNAPAYRGARILVTGPDFGCGSGDVFAGNCMQSGIVPVVLPPAEVEELWRQLRQAPGATVTVDLAAQCVTGPDGVRHGFEIDPTRKERLLKGLDDVGVTLEHLPEIEAFEAAYASRMPWRAPRT